MALSTALLLGLLIHAAKFMGGGQGLEMERRMDDISQVVLTSVCEFE